MSEPALRADVIKALKDKESLTVTVLDDGAIEVSSADILLTLPLGETVSRKMLSQLHRWFGIPMATFFPPESFKKQPKASGE